MSQSIKLKIAGKEYSLVAKDAEMQHYMRFAARDINQMIETYNKKYPDTQLFDKLVFVALNQTVGKLSSLHKLEVLKGQEDKLEKDLQAYLDKLDINR